MTTKAELLERLAAVEAELDDIKNPKPVYVLEITEYESGWGCKPDGYLAFKNREQAEAFVEEKYKGRGTAAPSYYVNYDHLGLKPALKSFHDKLALSRSGYAYIDKLTELTL